MIMKRAQSFLPEYPSLYLSYLPFFFVAVFLFILRRMLRDSFISLFGSSVGLSFGRLGRWFVSLMHSLSVGLSIRFVE